MPRRSSTSRTTTRNPAARMWSTHFAQQPQSRLLYTTTLGSGSRAGAAPRAAAAPPAITTSVRARRAHSHLSFIDRLLLCTGAAAKQRLRRPARAHTVVDPGAEREHQADSDAPEHDAPECVAPCYASRQRGEIEMHDVAEQVRRELRCDRDNQGARHGHHRRCDAPCDAKGSDVELHTPPPVEMDCLPAPRLTSQLRHRKYTAGITTNVRTVAVTMPPTIGAAMRFITSAPVPSLHRIGARPAMIAVTVIITGRRRCTAPSATAWASAPLAPKRPSAAARWNASSR